MKLKYIGQKYITSSFILLYSSYINDPYILVLVYFLTDNMMTKSFSLQKPCHVGLYWPMLNLQTRYSFLNESFLVFCCQYIRFTIFQKIIFSKLTWFLKFISNHSNYSFLQYQYFVAKFISYHIYHCLTDLLLLRYSIENQKMREKIYF